MTREKITLTETKETNLITLYGKAVESEMPGSLLKDRFGAEAVRKIDYDFSRFRLSRDDMIGLAIRAHVFDTLTRDFIARSPRATVLNLGWGLDSRVFRVDPSADVLWFDVDYPEVIDLRRRLYPARAAGYEMIGSSVTAPDWLSAVPADRPAIVIAEGLLMYIQANDVFQLVNRLTTHLPAGEIAFDIFTRLGTRIIQRHSSLRVTRATLVWSMEDPRELERQAPKLKFAAEYTPYDTGQVKRMSWPARATIRLFLAIPPLRRMARVLLYRF